MASNGEQHPRTWRAATRILALITLSFGALVWGVGSRSAPVSAQEPCTYPAYENCTTPTTDAGARDDPTLSLGMSLVAAGQVFAVVGCGYDPGTSLTFTFGGDVTATGDADANGCAPGSLTTPDVAPGTYHVCGVAAGFRTACQSIEVAGTAAERTGDRLVGATGSSGSPSGSSGLPRAAGAVARTGAGVLTPLSLAVLAIAFGTALKRRSGRRSLASNRRARRARSGYVV